MVYVYCKRKRPRLNGKVHYQVGSVLADISGLRLVVIRHIDSISYYGYMCIFPNGEQAYMESEELANRWSILAIYSSWNEAVNSLEFKDTEFANKLAFYTYFHRTKLTKEDYNRLLNEYLKDKENANQ